LWTDDLRTEVGSTIADDGIFFMAFADFLTGYADIGFNMEDDPNVY